MDRGVIVTDFNETRPYTRDDFQRGAGIGCETMDWQKGGSRSRGEEMVIQLINRVGIVTDVIKTRPYVRDDS